MQRRSFLKILGLATTCAIISNPIELLQAPVKPEARVWRMKISNQVLYSVKDARQMILENAKRHISNPDWESKTTMEIGFDGDDFIRDLRTIVFRYNP